MNITHVTQSWDLFNGCFYYRNYLPAVHLSKRGHEVGFLILGQTSDLSDVKDADVVVFSRIYEVDIIPFMNQLQRDGKIIVYESDDDQELVDTANPASCIIEKKIGTVKLLLLGSQAISTTTPYLAQRFSERYTKEIQVIPNSLDLDEYSIEQRKGRLRIGWAGGCTHTWDLLFLLDVIIELQKKYKFDFYFIGFIVTPLIVQEFAWRRLLEVTGDHNEQEVYLKASIEMCDKLHKVKNLTHIPFYTTEQFPRMLSEARLDIAVCPLLDSPFNRSKSCIKFYEYAATGAAVLASNVLPYSTEVEYLAENTQKDWYTKLEKLIVDAPFRLALAEKQRQWVVENRGINTVVTQWENFFKNISGK